MIVKEGLFGRKTVEGRRGKGEGNGVNMIEVHYIYYENSIMKCIKMLKRLSLRKSNIERISWIKVCYMHVYKYHNKIPLNS
jgi:hypothetical protein